MNTKLMRDASYLLPDPGGEVVRQLLDEVDKLKSELQQAYRAGWEQAKREATTVMVHRHNCLYQADGSTKHTLDVIDSCIDDLSAITYKEPTNER